MEKAQKKLSGPNGPPERAEPNQSGPYSGGQEQAYGRTERSTRQDWLDEDDLDGPDGYDLDPYAEDYEPSSGGRGNTQSSLGQTDDRDRRIPQPERELYDPRRHGSGGRADRPQKSRSLGQSLGEILQEMMGAGSMIDGPGRSTRQPETSRPHRTEPEKNVSLPYDEPLPSQHSLPKSVHPPATQVPTQPATRSLEHPEMREAKEAPADIIKYDYSDGYISRAERKAKRKSKKITKLRPSNLKQAVLFSEILNPPRSARWKRSNR